MAHRNPVLRERREFATSKGVYFSEPDDVLGRGTYGVVYRVRSKENPSVRKAIKTFAPETIDENEGIPSTTLREINALKTINHPNVMSVEEVVIPSHNSLTDMFVVMELCKGTLKDKINDMIKRHLKNNPTWLNPPDCAQLPVAYVQEAKITIWQLLNAIAACHSRGVMHRDLKPVNVMWGYDDLLKLGDFGLARFVRGNQNAEDGVIPQTGEVQTMWYRAPEVLLGDEQYGMLVDDWSLGCVMAEFFRFRVSSVSGNVEPCPLFTGRGDVDTLLLIFEALGTPQPSVYSEHRYLSTLPYWTDEFPKWRDGNLRSRVKLLDKVGFDLLCELLRVSPTNRKAARFLLDHPWFADVSSIVKQRYTPWFRGLETEYAKLMEVDRLPSARPLDAAGNPVVASKTVSSAPTEGYENVRQPAKKAVAKKRSAAPSQQRPGNRPGTRAAGKSATAAAKKLPGKRRDGTANGMADDGASQRVDNDVRSRSPNRNGMKRARQQRNSQITCWMQSMKGQAGGE